MEEKQNTITQNTITIKITGTPTIINNLNHTVTIACEIYDNKYPYMLELTPLIYKKMIAELKKYNIQIDNDLNCLKNKIFTITHKNWNSPPKSIWLDEELPIVLDVSLRKDL